MRQIHWWRLVLVLSLAFLVAFAPLQPHAASAQSSAAIIILADRLNVRSGPGTGYAVVASSRSGEKYNVIGQNGSCAWLKIASGDKALGWVSGNKAYVKLNASCSSIPSAGAVVAPSAGRGKQGCALLTNQLQFDVKLSVKRTDGWQSSWSIPKGGQTKACVDPGSYTATFTTTGMPGNMAFPVTVRGGEYYEIPLSLPGN